MRVTSIHDVTPMMRVMESSDGRTNAASASSRKMGGKDSIASVTRSSTVSIAPRKYPATVPTRAPKVTVTSIAATPTVSEMRPACRSRLRTSRPSSSAPSTWPLASGGANLCAIWIWIGSGRRRPPAKAAPRTRSAITTDAADGGAMAREAGQDGRLAHDTRTRGSTAA